MSQTFNDSVKRGCLGPDLGDGEGFMEEVALELLLEHGKRTAGGLRGFRVTVLSNGGCARSSVRSEVDQQHSRPSHTYWMPGTVESN